MDTHIGAIAVRSITAELKIYATDLIPANTATVLAGTKVYDRN